MKTSTLFKLVVMRGLRMFGWDIIRCYKALHAEQVAVLSCVVARRVAEKDGADFSFVQIGANDGCSHGDPVFSSVKSCWRGVVLEPNPATFCKLADTYRNYPDVVCVNAAVAERDGTAQMFVPLAASESTQCSLKSSVASPALGIEVQCRKVAVNTVTIRTLFQRHGVQSLDLLVVDAEGCDYDIVLQLLATDVRPAIVQFEHGAMTAAEFARAYMGMKDAGYKVSVVDNDTLCVYAK